MTQEPWKLWVDDQLDDPETPIRHVPEGFVGARSSVEAIALVQERGLPIFMDLDHDLGGDDTVMVFLRYLTRQFYEGPVPGFRVHTENIVGAKAIEAYLKSWEKSLSSVTFTIGSKEWAKIQDFCAEHHKLHRGKDGAIGGRFTYSFTPTTIFTKISCQCACGQAVDVTDYGSV